MAGLTIIHTRGKSPLPGPTFSGSARRPLFQHVGTSDEPQHSYGWLSQTLAFSTFLMLVAFYVALPSLKFGGQPLRGIIAIAVLTILPLACPKIAQAALRKYWPLIALAVALCVIGVFVSLANRTPLDVIIQTLLEVHLQVVILMLVAGMLAEICGARLCMWAIVAVICASAAVALLQMFGADFAWDLRRSLGPFAKEELHPNIVDRRPSGLSYSPIQLSTQLCLAFAVFAAVRHSERKRAHATSSADPAIFAALLVLVVGSIAVATRSPILGGVIFLCGYAMLRRRSWLPVAILFGALLLYFAWPLIMSFVESEAPRVLRTDDKSAAARSVFAYYGVRLFIDNPLGYGFGFQPADMWATYWPDLYFMRGSRGTQEHTLHNYLLSMINIYGVGILLIAPLVVRLLVRASPYLIFFVPYFVHILFHNSGPFFSDTILWFVIAAIGAATAQTTHQGLRRPHSPLPRLDRAPFAMAAGKR